MPTLQCLARHTRQWSLVDCAFLDDESLRFVVQLGVEAADSKYYDAVLLPLSRVPIVIEGMHIGLCVRKTVCSGICGRRDKSVTLSFVRYDAALEFG